jgi:hypothetical protein
MLKSFKIMKAISLLILILLGTYCTVSGNGQNHGPADQRNSVRTGLPRNERQKSDFGFLKKGMSYQEIVTRVGEADRDVGSGLYVYEYALADGSRIYLSFASINKLLSANIKYPDGRSERLVGP